MKKLLFLLCVSLLIQCKKNTGNDCACKQHACTEIFATLMIHVKDKNGHPVALDDYYTIHKSDGDTILINGFDSYYDSINQVNGTYPVINDLYLENNSNCSEAYEFIGIKEGIAIARETFHIRNNCCHVEWVGEHDDIVVD